VVALIDLDREEEDQDQMENYKQEEDLKERDLKQVIDQQDFKQLGQQQPQLEKVLKAKEGLQMVN